VCRLWQHVARDSSLWKKRTFNFDSRATESEVMQRLQSFKNPTALNLSVCLNIDEFGLTRIFQTFTSLQQLYLCGLKVNIVSMTECLTKITILDLSCTNIEPQDLDVLSKQYKNCLEALYLSECPHLDSRGNFIFSKLSELDLSNSISSFKNYYSRLDMNNFVFLCPQLETLCLSCCNRVDDEVLDRISNSSPNLKRLNVERCLGVTDEGLTHLSKLALCSLSVAWNSEITCNGMKSFLSKSSTLKTLDIRYCKHHNDIRSLCRTKYPNVALVCN